MSREAFDKIKAGLEEVIEFAKADTHSHTDGLKACPFCGSNNLTVNYGGDQRDGWFAHIDCQECDDMIGPMSEYKYDAKEDAADDAAKIWNDRPDVVEEILALLTAHELYQYRPKAFQGFIDHVRQHFSTLPKPPVSPPMTEGESE